MKSEKETLFSLAPNINLEDDAHYKVYEAYIDSALKNQIDNLAITGKYGSGKSSIVDTYFHNKEDVLKVSFSTFESVKENDNSKNDPKGDPKGIIFANIINQIIYQINPKEIPLTKFKLKKPLSPIAKSVLASEMVSILFQFVIPKRDGISFFILSLIIFLISSILGFIILWQLFSRNMFFNKPRFVNSARLSHEISFVVMFALFTNLKLTRLGLSVDERPLKLTHAFPK